MEGSGGGQPEQESVEEEISCSMVAAATTKMSNKQSTKHAGRTVHVIPFENLQLEWRCEDSPLWALISLIGHIFTDIHTYIYIYIYIYVDR